MLVVVAAIVQFAFFGLFLLFGLAAAIDEADATGYLPDIARAHRDASAQATEEPGRSLVLSGDMSAAVVPTFWGWYASPSERVSFSIDPRWVPVPDQTRLGPTTDAGTNEWIGMWDGGAGDLAIDLFALHEPEPPLPLRTEAYLALDLWNRELDSSEVGREAALTTQAGYAAHELRGDCQVGDWGCDFALVVVSDGSSVVYIEVAASRGTADPSHIARTLAQTISFEPHG